MPWAAIIQIIIELIKNCRDRPIEDIKSQLRNPGPLQLLRFRRFVIQAQGRQWWIAHHEEMLAQLRREADAADDEDFDFLIAEAQQ